MAAKTVAGIDIGSTSIRAVETSLVRGRPVLSRFAHVPLAPGVLVGGMVIDQPAVTAALKRLWSQGHFRTRNVVLGITHHRAVVREMSLPALNPRELRQALPFQVADVLPFAADRAVMDFHAFEVPAPTVDTDAGTGGGPTASASGTDPDTDRGTGTAAGGVRGLLVAVPREPVLALVEAVEKARLRVDRVDLGTLAVLRAAARGGTGAAHALVDLGAHATSVIVHVDGRPRIIRTFPRGGNDITALLAATLKLDTADAERLKREVGVLPGQDKRTAALIEAAARPLLSEMRGSLAYASGGAGTDVPVSHIEMCGGGALLPGLLDLLAVQMGVPVTLIDPTARFSGHRRADAYEDLTLHRSMSTGAVGLTLSGAA